MRGVGFLKVCPECRKSFKGKKKQTYCSRECRGAHVKRESREEINCCNCSKPFYKLKSQINRSVNHYCSVDCKNEHYSHKFKGSKNPNWKGLTRRVNCSFCGTSFIYTDYYGSKNKYCSTECKGEHQKITLVGENNPNYKESIENDERVKNRTYTGYKEWRMKVFKRDGFNCLKCGTNSTRDNKLVAHHILNHYSHPELRIDVDNGATLCSECHWEFHRIYGTLYNNRDQLEEFITPKAIDIC